MRVGIDARLWNESGIGRYIRNLVRELQQIDKKNEYVLFVRSKDYESIKNLSTSEADRELRIKSQNWKFVITDIHWHTIAEQLHFPEILNSQQLDLVHFPYFSVPIFYNRPFIVTIHDLILHHFPTGEASTLPFFLYQLKLLGYRYIIRQAAQKAKKIITVSNSTKEEIIDHLHSNPEKITVTYEGVDDRLTNPSFKVQSSQLKNFASKKFFLYVGNAYPHKNLEKVLKVFSEMKRLSQQNNEKIDVSFVLVGKEDYFYKKLKEKVKDMDIARQIIFYGFAEDKELSELYENAIALIAPSRMEGFGLPVLEAMEKKCLILASDIPAHREITGGNAIFFDPWSVDDMRAKLERVYFADKKEFEPIMSQAREKSKEYSWKKLAENTLKVYESSPSTSSG